MSSALVCLAIALIVFGAVTLWRAREVVPALCRAAWNALGLVPRLLHSIVFGNERAPRPRHAWQKPRVRITWVARTALLPTCVAAVIWQWHGRSAMALFATDLEIDALAPRSTPPDSPLPLRVVTSPLGGGGVRTDLHWRALGNRCELLAQGDAVCWSSTTILLPAAKHVRAVELLARGPKGEQSLRLDRSEPLPPPLVHVTMDRPWGPLSTRLVLLDRMTLQPWQPPGELLVSWREDKFQRSSEPKRADHPEHGVYTTEQRDPGYWPQFGVGLRGRGPWPTISPEAIDARGASPSDQSATVESGTLVAGLPARIYVDLRDPLGRALLGKGVLRTRDGTAVADVRIGADGRDRVAFTPLDGADYEVAFDELGVRLPLPPVAANGVTLRACDDVFAAASPIAVDVRSQPSQPLHADVFCRGVPVGHAPVPRSGGRVEIPLPPAVAGVLRVTVFDEANVPVAERLVQRLPAGGVQVQVDAASARLRVQTRDERGKPLPCTLGVSVTAASPAAPGLDVHAFLLADVGDIDVRAADTPAEVDRLLGCQGWRRYAWRGSPQRAAAVGECDAFDHAQTRCAAKAHELIKTAEVVRSVAWVGSCVGLWFVGLWLVAEAGAWLVRRALRSAATMPWQIVGGLLVSLPATYHAWAAGEIREYSYHGAPPHQPFIEFLQYARYAISGYWYGPEWRPAAGVPESWLWTTVPTESFDAPLVWEPCVQTDARGEAVIELPANAPRGQWSVHVDAHAPGRVGSARTSFATK